MILVIDAGNTNITLGVFDGEELEATFRMTTKIPRTSDEYGITIRDMLAHDQKKIQDEGELEKIASPLRDAILKD